MPTGPTRQSAVEELTLVKDTYTFKAYLITDEGNADPRGSTEFASDLNEPLHTSYTTGYPDGITLAPTVTEDAPGQRVILGNADVTFVGVGDGTDVVRGAAVARSTGNKATSPVWDYYDSNNITINGGDVTVSFGNGIRVRNLAET